MNNGPSPEHSSFVGALLEGRVDLTELTPFPILSSGRMAQFEELLDHLRRDQREASGVQRLREWDLLSRPIDWPTPLLARVIHQAGGTDASAALSAIVHLALGVRLIRSWGTESQQSQFGGTEKALCAFALTEASPGSDVSRIQTHAEATENGFVLNGTKHWVTNAKWATHFIVVARTAPPRASNKPKLTAFIVKAGPGVEIKDIESDVLPGSGVAEVRFNQVHLSKGDILGAEGKGFRVVMGGLAEARLFVGAAVLGACIRAFNDTVRRVAERRAFGRPVGNFPTVQAKISGMLADILAMESLVHGVAGLSEPGATVDPIERGVVRLAVSRGAARVLDAARELHGAAAYAGDVAAARHWADTRALTLLDGSDLALESYIVLEGTREVRHRLSRLDVASDLLNRVDAAASLLVEKGKNRWRKASPQEIPGVSMVELHDFAQRLGSSVEASVRKYGIELVEKQHVQSRLASVAVELATWAALAARVKSEVERMGEVGSRRMIDVASLWVHDARARVQGHFDAMESNVDRERDAVAVRAYLDKAYPFDVF